MDKQTQGKVASDDYASESSRSLVQVAGTSSKMSSFTRKLGIRKSFSPLWFLVIFIGGIFLAEIVAMIVVFAIGPMPYQFITLLDDVIMVILIFPLVYFLALRPILDHIDKRWQAEQALLRSTELRDRFFDSIEILIAYMDCDYNFIRVNEAYAQAGGHPTEYFVGKNHFALYPSDENQGIFQRVVATGAGFSVSEKPFEYPEYPERGVTYWNWNLQPVKGLDGSVEGLVLSLLDVTTRKRAEEELRKANDELELRVQWRTDELRVANSELEEEINERVKAEDKLRRARDELELRVQERTKELEVANHELLFEIYEREDAERQLLIQTTAMEAAANGILITDAEGEIMWVNPALNDMTGYTADELVSQSMRILKSGQHDQSYYRQMWDTILTGEVWHGETTNRRKDGSLYVEDQTITPVKDADGQISHFIAIKHDITEQKQIRAALEVERMRLKNIMDTIPDGVYIVNQEYDIEYVNPVIEKEFGLVSGQKCYAYFHDLTAPCPWCMNEKVLSGWPLRGERTYTKINKIYEIFDAPFANADGTMSKLKLLHDVTRRHKMEQELEQSNLELQAVSSAEREQRQTAETLRAATQDLTRSLDLDTVLNALLKHVTVLVDTDIASVGFVEDETRLVARVAYSSERRAVSNVAPIFPIDAKTDFFFQKVAKSRRSVFVRDVTREPDWINYPGIEPIRNWLGVPILVSDNVIGVVLMGKIQSGFFTREHAKSAEALVGQAAVAIQNAWLFEQVRAGRERLQLLSRRLVEIQESERRYIARELHDQAGQSLSSLLLGLGQLEKGSEHGGQQVHIRKLKLLANDILEDLHRLAVDLRPASLDHLGLVPALEQLVDSYQRNEQLDVKFKSIGLGEAIRLPSEIETTLYRIVQEALTNVTRHAKASRADVILELREDTVILIVEDNGIGFDATFSLSNEHLGLIGIRERTEMLGGNLTVESTIGSGTILVVEVPNANTHPIGG